MHTQDLQGEELDPGQQRLEFPLQMHPLDIALQQLRHEQEILCEYISALLTLPNRGMLTSLFALRE
jgi:hypothetical protein